MKALPLLLIFSLPLPGCIVLPFPHTENTSPRVLGRVCDSAYEEAIPSAQVHFAGREKHRVQTDETGRFELKPESALVLFTIFYADDQTDIPSPRTFPNAVVVRHPGYETLSVQFAPYTNQKPHDPRGDTRVLDLGDVKIRKANPQGGANGRQPVSSGTNRTSAAAASRRSP